MSTHVEPPSLQDCLCTLNNTDVLPWFPAKPSTGIQVNATSTHGIDSSEHDALIVPYDALKVFRPFSRQELDTLYRSFFTTLYRALYTSSYLSVLKGQRRWNARFSYHDFTAPWMKSQLVFNGHYMYIHKTKKTIIPSARDLRSSAGNNLIPHLLAVFYDREPICKQLLRALLPVRSRQPENVLPPPIQRTNTSVINSEHSHIITEPTAVDTVGVPTHPLNEQLPCNSQHPHVNSGIGKDFYSLLQTLQK